MYQPGCTDLEISFKKRATQRERFLVEVEQVVP